MANVFGREGNSVELVDMSQLTIYNDADPATPLAETTDFERIADELGKAGIRFERWRAGRELPEDADNDTIIDAYREEIDRLVGERGYRTFDVVSMHPEHPERDAFRRKFLEEHTHSEDEVRFFVRGQGLFVIHKDGKVYSMLCQQDDLISVPANTRHWFDMGPRPRFTAIRLFDNPEGWVAQFTGDRIARRFPLLET